MQLKTILRRLGWALPIAAMLSLVMPVASPASAAPAVPAVSSAAAAPCPGDPLTSTQKRDSEVQLRLAGLNLYKGRVDAKWGPQSQAALDTWRRSQNLDRTGPITTAEYNMLRSRTLLGYSVKVSLSNQTITFYKNGQAFYRDHVSTGKPSTPTPIIKSKVLWQIPGWRRSHLGCLYYPSYFHSAGIAIHGSNSVPNHPASHSCVRVFIPLGYAQYKVLQPAGNGRSASEISVIR